MKIITWNVNHRIREKAIPLHMAAALRSLEPEVIVLTEYVPGPSRHGFLAELADGGLPYLLCSASAEQHNHVLIASKTSLSAGEIVAPLIAPSFPSNALHAELTEINLEVLGIRIPDFSKKPKIRRECWDWILTIASELKSRPSVILGDFNTDPKYSRARCGERFEMMQRQGWQHAAPSTGESYWTPNGSGVRIDHAFVSEHVEIRKAEYVREANGYVFAGKEGMSDHAPLMIDIKLTGK